VVIRVRRGLLVLTAVIGLGLAVAPLAFDMFSRAPKGAVMLADFKPFMTDQRLNGFQAEMRQINASVREIDASDRASLPPTYTDFDKQWPQIDSVMTNLLDQVHGNVGNYDDVAALPSFKLFPWFFLIPGVLIFALSVLALLGRLPVRGARIALGVFGVGLIAAPVIFQMFTRAPHGAQMMSAFKTIETTQNVERIQSYFSTMASGQGAIRNQVVPALVSATHGEPGRSTQQIAQDYPATTTLDANWVHILNDMTPMIAAMSDSVPRYQAIRALPPFTLFPWFFVIPGVIVAGAAVGAGKRREPIAPQPIAVPETV
jgi:hypothetical protein